VQQDRFAREGDYITLYIPAKGTALVFRVRAVSRFSIDYGPLPIPAGLTLPTYDGTSVTVPAYGVLPGRALVPQGITFPSVIPNVYDGSDMWYVPEDYRDRLFHVVQRVTPSWLRIDVQVPSGVVQSRFQKDRGMGGVDRAFGYTRGTIETIHIPKVHYGFRYGNDTNIDARTFVRFEYAEYAVDVPANPELIFDILTRRVPSLWFTLPISIPDPSVEGALEVTYGAFGFPLYRADERARALEEYRKILDRILSKYAGGGR
jgi:hypothetical protein